MLLEMVCSLSFFFNAGYTVETAKNIIGRKISVSVLLAYTTGLERAEPLAYSPDGLKRDAGNAGPPRPYLHSEFVFLSDLSASSSMAAEQ